MPFCVSGNNFILLSFHCVACGKEANDRRAGVVSVLVRMPSQGRPEC